jgi:hypothetical protein
MPGITGVGVWRGAQVGGSRGVGAAVWEALADREVSDERDVQTACS